MLGEFPGITQHQYAVLLSLKCGFRLQLEVMLDTVVVVVYKTVMHWKEGD